MVTPTDPTLLALQTAASNEASRQEQLAAAAAPVTAAAGQAAADPAVASAAAGIEQAAADQQQAIKLIVQSLGVSPEMLDDLTAALGGSAEPVPQTVALPQELDTAQLEISTVATLTTGFIPKLAELGGQAEAGSTISDAASKLAKQILEALKQAQLPPAENGADSQTAAPAAVGSTSTAPNSAAAEPGPRSAAARAAQIVDLTKELKNLLQTTLWLRSLEETQPQPDPAQSSPSSGVASSRPAEGISQLLTILQLTANSASSADTAAGEQIKKAISSALAGKQLPSAAGEIFSPAADAAAAAALLADPDSAELIGTITKSIDVVSRLLERAAPAETKDLRLALAGLKTAIDHLTPPAALNPTEINPAPPEPVRRETAQAIAAVRIEINRLANQTEPGEDSAPAEAAGRAVGQWLAAISDLLDTLEASPAQPGPGAPAKFAQSAGAAAGVSPDSPDLPPARRAALARIEADLRFQQLLVETLDKGGINEAPARTQDSPKPAKSELAVLFSALNEALAEYQAAPQNSGAETALRLQPLPTERLVRDLQAILAPIASTPPVLVQTGEDGGAGTTSRLNDILRTIEKRGLELILHQISSLSGHEQGLSTLQTGLEQDSAAATAIQTVKLLEKSLANSAGRNADGPEMAAIRDALKSIESVLAESMANNAPPPPEKIDAAWSKFAAAAAAGTAGGPQAPRLVPLTKLEIALSSLLEQQLTGLKLLTPPEQTALQPQSSGFILPQLPQIAAPAGSELFDLLRFLKQTSAPRLELLKIIPQFMAAQTDQQTAQTPAATLSADREIQSRFDQIRSASSELRQPVPPAQNPSQSKSPPVQAQRAAAAGDQIARLAQSLSLQLDLLEESAGLPDLELFRFPSTAQDLGLPRIANGSNRQRDPLPQLSQASLAQTASGQAADAERLPPVRPSGLGARIDSILSRIDQLRRGGLDDGANGDKPADLKLLDVLHQTTRRLQERTAGTEQPIAGAELEQAVGRLEQAFRQISTSDRQPAGQAAVFAAIRQIETLIRGQEALSYLNPVMQALGEPTFILFPAVIHGMMIRIELLLYPNVDPDAQKGSKEKGRQKSKKDADGEQENSADGEKRRKDAEKRAYRRLKLALSMPSLGRVGIDFAHTLEEALLAVSAPNSDAALQIMNALPELQLTFAGLGFKTIDFDVRSEQAADLQPAWLQDLLRINAITA